MRSCFICRAKIDDTESCWRDNQKRTFCTDCKKKADDK